VAEADFTPSQIADARPGAIRSLAKRLPDMLLHNASPGFALSHKPL
jgi:hypothetical protein